MQNRGVAAPVKGHGHLELFETIYAPFEVRSLGLQESRLYGHEVLLLGRWRWPVGTSSQ